MPESKYKRSCYCTQKPFSCQHDLALNAKYGKTVLGKKGIVPETKSNSKYVFVKLKRSNDEQIISSRKPKFPPGQANFCRRSSTSTIGSNTAPYASCNSSGSSRAEVLPVNNNLASQVNKLKYSDRRTYYEYLHRQSELHPELEKFVDVSSGSMIGTSKKTEKNDTLLDPEYLRDLQEFRLRNRTECFS